jgi:ankyrin repeat protein
MRIMLVLCCGLLSCGKDLKMSALDSSKYFTDSRVSAFVDDVQRGNVARVREALAAGIDPNVEGIEGFRPIHFVFVAKDTETLKALLEAGADPNARLANGNTPLHFAVRLPNSAFTQVLLHYKADPNSRGENGKPVIHEAVFSDQSSNVILLIKDGADINAEWGGGTPLYNAISSGSWDIATNLLELGAQTTHQDKRGKTAVDLFCGDLSRIRITDKTRKSIPSLYKAFMSRGVSLNCDKELSRFD